MFISITLFLLLGSLDCQQMGFAWVTWFRVLAGRVARPFDTNSFIICKHSSRLHDLPFVTHGHHKDIPISIFFKYYHCNK